MKRVYIAGPMTGLKDLNFPAFHAAATVLRAQGHVAINPAEVNPDHTTPRVECMKKDIPELLTCNSLHLLKGWHLSRGASLEQAIASALDFSITIADGARHPDHNTPTLSMSCYQLRAALAFAWPEMDDVEQGETELVFQRLPERMSIDGEPMEAGLYCYLADLPEEGVFLLSDEPDLTALPHFDFHLHLKRQAHFSETTFGPGLRTGMVIDHIRKELIEIAAAPTDLGEWIDVVLLALDGAWRTGHAPAEIIEALKAKQTKNERRTWPDWRTSDPDKAIEHSRTSSECWSVDQEDFNARSLAELIENNIELHAGQIVYVGTAISPTADQLCDADDLIEMMGDRAHDIGGEYADDYPDVSQEAKTELNALLASWVTRHCPPSFYTVGGIKQYKLLESDLSGNQAGVGL